MYGIDEKKIGSTYFNDELVYDGNDLGAVYTKEKTTKQNRIQPPARLRARGYLWALLRQNSRRWQLWQSTKKNITALMLATA